MDQITQPEVRMEQGSVLWRREDTSSVEHCTVQQADHGWRIDGAVVLALDGVPSSVRYTIACDAGWITREVQIELRHGLAISTLHLSVDQRGHWWRDDVDVIELCGCHDVDLSVTPATNTLPIRRLDLAVGAEQAVVAAWVRFPDLTIAPLPQRYTRVDDRRYRYEGGSDFKALLEVDQIGLVTSYNGLWRRVG